RGPFDAGDETTMQAIVSRTKNYLGSTDMMIDYDHQTAFGAIPGVGGTAKAAGWVKEFEVRSDGIYGRVEWTAAAKAAIEASEYRYISPLFTRDTAGKVTALRNAALLNMPAMDLEAIAARAFPKTTKGPDMDEILEALGLTEGAGDEEALASITSLMTGLSDIAVAAGLDKSADVAAVAASVADLAKAAKSTEPDPAKYVPIEQVTAMQADLKSLRDTIESDKAEELVSVWCVSTRTSTAITGAASYDCGIAGETSKFGGSLGISEGSTNAGVIGPQAFYSDTAVRLTANGGSFTAGAVKVLLHFMLPVVPGE
ncbi:MAG: phage protease, partial [Hyphomicrobiales bacterium]